ncbi:glycoside hydrolase family 2 TIM barrel-domain containing protein [Hymenobacter terricola]|uniref:glycoside hydrolase family 2 TIM barrel-domain containing protein n=1 Tax=Hymenobacter terricola TaxID=2819236 RepID=UPI001B306D74|nr:glycoside hydrolase family 2 TIM barrel-domain containing protein [Hymenobacter terricola]
MKNYPQELSNAATTLGTAAWQAAAAVVKWVLLAGWGGALLTGCDQTPAGADGRAASRVGLPKEVVAVRVQKTAHGFQLLRGGKPYFIRGGGGLQRFAQLQEAGGNSARLWSVDYATPLLDEAQHRGVTIMLGLWLEPESSYFSYYDPGMVQAQLQRLRQQVLRYRYHPALLMWNVGNEVELTTSGPRLFKSVNAIARMIHELDPYHPVTISLGDGDLIFQGAQLQQLAPEVDIMSVNSYGRLLDLPQRVQKSGWKRPYIVTEYGGKGFWETDSTFWKAPEEQTSAGKAEFISSRYRQVIQADSNRCLGSYLFYWGSKFEYTPTWFSLFEPSGEKTESVDEMHLLWRKHYPANRSPHLTELRLAGQAAANEVTLRAGQRYPAVVRVTDPEGDSLTARWEVLPEMRPGAEIKEVATPLEPVPGCVVKVAGRQAIIRMPSRPGAYRVYVRVFDGHGSVATANIPVLVRPAPKAAAYSAATSSD